MQSHKLLKLLRDTGAMLEGHFLLTSGRHSKVYIEKFRILENPDFLDQVCNKMAKVVINDDIDIVLGAAIGGILISGGMGRHLRKKHIFAEREDGKMKLRRGFIINSGERVVIVEDIITTGGSVFELIKVAEDNGAKIIGIVSLIHRSKEKINFGHNYRTLLEFPVDSWDESDMPDWLSNIEITKPGRTGKK